jgi:regulator of nucleoside diphosphate kinase
MELSFLDRTLTELDHVRLTHLLYRNDGGALPAAQAAAIADLLDGALVVPSRRVAPDVVTMYTRVVLRDVDSGAESTVTLTYPADAEPAEGFVSVLSPIGWSLLGLPVDSQAQWSTPDGGHRTAEIRAILFQPEASGDYTL